MSQAFVQFLINYSGFNIRLKILLSDINYPVHLRKVQNNTTFDRNGITLYTATGAPRGYRNYSLICVTYYLRDFFTVYRPYNYFRYAWRMLGLVLGMKLPVLGTHAFGFGFILHIGGEAMEGVEFPTGKPVVPSQLDENDPKFAYSNYSINYWYFLINSKF